MLEKDLAKKLYPKDYDYMWVDYDVDYIFASCYLFKRFRAADIVLIYDHKDSGLRFFLNKKERAKMAKSGLKFYSNLPAGWRRKMVDNIKLGKKLLLESEKHKKIITKINTKDLGEHLLKRAKFFQSLGNEYFFTEFFFLDLVEKLSKERKRGQIVRRNIESVAKLKLEAREILNNFYNYKKVFKIYVAELEKRLKRKNLRWLSFVDVYSLAYGKSVGLSVLNKNDWLLSRHNNWQVVTGGVSKIIKKRFEKYFFQKELTEFKGQVANAGKYVGVVKIIRTLFSDEITKELSKVKKGDVLVAETTGPEMIVACKRAGAIVTDQGGVTSHAAIVSRELGIPCIIGTKIATKFLKDGDRVEVGAVRGVVKKL